MYSIGGNLLRRAGGVTIMTLFDSSCVRAKTFKRCEIIDLCGEKLS